ncbi:MAG TPA: hypothetical protein VGY55_24985 [Pirellulales bacterium]|nr:hypothetical protein [Pirellulales bacterium]
MFRCELPSVAASICLALAGVALAAGHAKTVADPAGGRISILIRQLGDEQYSVRQQAQEELARLGAEAFDQLVAAEQNDDVEIASRAAYLVRLIRIDWVHDSDSPQVKELLKDYDDQPDDARWQRMQQLAESPRDVGLEPLCRLIRFERSPLLSKQGAILVLRQPEPEAAHWPRRASIITSSLKGSDRPASKWLLAYAQFRAEPEAALAQWEQLVNHELAVVEPNAPDDETRIQTFLLRQQAEMLLKQKHFDRALDVMRKMIDRQNDDAEALIEFVEWLIKNKAWSVVDDVARRFDRTFAGNPKLLYTLAQARKAEGNDELAEQFALRAFQLSANLSANADDLKPRLAVAGWLEANGMRPWCEREFRHVISRGKQDSDEVIESRLVLSEILHDQEREQEAAEVLQGLVDAVAKSSDLDTKLASQLRHPPKSIRSRMYYFYACQFESKKDRAHQIEQLRLAIASDPNDADVLIAIYHLPGQDEQARKQNLDLIRAAAAQFRVELNDDPDQYSVYNEYAWLVANTEGDLDQALEYAHKAVELRPDEGGLLDTLAHCYAAKKDFENAVTYQTRAAELDPYSLQIRRALDDYRKSLAASKQRK